MRVDLVIARYNENIAWADDMPSYNVILYNKGEPVGERGIQGQYREVFLPNVGREAGTYLYHLINEYDNLGDLTAFIQGHPFPHSPNLFNDLKPLTTLEFNESEPFTGYIPLGYMNLISDRDGGSPIAGQPFHIGGLEVGRLVELIFRELRPDIADRQHFEFSAGACFLAGRDTIRAKPRAWYQHVLNCCEEVGEGYPWVMERLWQYIFQ